MPAISAYDGTQLGYHVLGDGTPVVCLPGGMQDSAYLGSLGGLSALVRLVLVDHRGTGSSAVPADPLSYRCDRLVDDVEALRSHLGLATMTLLGHSGGANTALLYATRYPSRIDKLVLVTPSTMAVGLTPTADVRRAVLRQRSDEPWFPQASEAFERIAAGAGTPADWTAIAPFAYGRWDASAQAHHFQGEERRNTEAFAIFGSAFDPPATRAALGRFPAPVLLLAGALDVTAPPPAVASLAELVPNSSFVTLQDCGHFPWLDRPAQFVETIESFLR